MTKQQPAVEWLFEQIPAEWSSSKSAFDAYQQAKQMEKERMTNFANEYADAVMLGCIKRAEQYLNETYGTE
jgi:hypothetical protein